MCARAQTLKLLLSALSTAGSADQLLAPLAKQTLQVLVDNVKCVAPLLPFLPSPLPLMYRLLTPRSRIPDPLIRPFLVQGRRGQAPGGG